MILLDTSGLLAWIDAGQRRHREVTAAMAAAKGPFLLSPFVLAELDYLLATRVGPAAQVAALEEVEIGLTDASIAVLAGRHACDTVLTLDERHFRVLRVQGKPFRLLPSDA